MSDKFIKFSNGVVVVNTTPHPVTMQDVNGTLTSVPNVPEYLLNARVEERQVDNLLVTTEFVPSDDGYEIIERIKRDFSLGEYGDTLIILGSVIAAQAYKGQVFGMTPVPGYERVAPAEKRMRCDKFTVFQ